MNTSNGAIRTCRRSAYLFLSLSLPLYLHTLSLQLHPLLGSRFYPSSRPRLCPPARRYTDHTGRRHLDRPQDRRADHPRSPAVNLLTRTDTYLLTYLGNCRYLANYKNDDRAARKLAIACRAAICSYSVIEVCERVSEGAGRRLVDGLHL